LGERGPDIDDAEGLLDTNREGVSGDPDRLLEIYLIERLLPLLLLRERVGVALLLRDLPLVLP